VSRFRPVLRVLGTWRSFPRESGIGRKANGQLAKQNEEIMFLLRTSVLLVGLAGVAGANNLILNGDFSLGYTDFTSGYTEVPNGTYTGPGDYGLTTNPSTAFTNGYQPFTPYDGGTYMLFADGGSPSTAVWSEDDINVVAGTTYTFEAYVADADPSGYSGNPAILDLLVNGTTVGTSYDVPNNPGAWELWTFTYTATSSGSITLSIVDANTNPDGAGNDFAIDDLCLIAPGSSCASSTSPVPEPSSVGFCLIGLLGMGVGGALRRKA